MRASEEQSLNFKVVKKFFSETTHGHLVFDTVMAALELLNSNPSMIKEYLALRFMKEKIEVNESNLTNIFKSMKKYSNKHMRGAMITSDVPKDEYMHAKVIRQNFITLFNSIESNIKMRPKEWISEINALIREKEQTSIQTQIDEVKITQQVSEGSEQDQQVKGTHELGPGL